MFTKIRINDKIDEKLLQNFPYDPYSDITIITPSGELHLALAYLSLDSRYFASLPQNTSILDLSHMNEQRLVYVLRALYGGELQACSITQLQQCYQIIDELQIDEYKQNIANAIKNCHQAKKQNSILNLIELIQFCVRNDVLRQYVCLYHFQNRLKSLESSKNYLQLGKLSDGTINYILVQFHKMEGEGGDAVINHILENYFNRKSYRPAEYFQNQEIAVLRTIWQKFHHKITVKNIAKLDKPIINDMKSTTFMRRQSDSIGISKINKLQSLANFKKISVDFTNQLFKSNNMDEQGLLDMRIQSLTKQLEQRNRKIQCLQEQFKQLTEMKLNKDRQAQKSIEASMDEISLLKNMMKLRRTKEEMVMAQRYDSSVNANEFAYQNVKKAIQVQKEGKQTHGRDVKLKLVSKPSMTKKIFT